MKPTFVGIGAQKCASTWLYRILAEHPQVGVSTVKELDFFSDRFEQGYAWYESHFSGYEGKGAVGEISPSYFCHPQAPQRVSAYAPEARILVSFRDPVERALSNHRHEVRIRHLRGDARRFETALAANPLYVEQGRYATHLRRWLEYFPRERVLPVFMEDVRRRPQELAREVFAFVGVDPDFRPEGLTTRYNASYVDRFQWLSRAKDLCYAAARRPGLAWAWRWADAAGLKRLYRRLNHVASDEAIPPASEAALSALRRRFAPEVAELERLLGTTLEGWR